MRTHRIILLTIAISIFYSASVWGRGQRQTNVLYNAQIDKAELAIVDSDFVMALRYYDSAFLYKQSPFAQDIYNAAICAIEIRSLDKALLLCKRLAGKGTDAMFFEKKSVFGALKKLNEWADLLRYAGQIAEKLHDKNREVVEAIDSLYRKDQLIHREWSQSDNNRNLEEKMKTSDRLNSTALLKIFKQYGYLYEDIIGVNLSADTILELEPKFSIIMLHNYQGRIQSDTLFTEMLREMLLKGLIKPEFFANIQDRGSNMGDRDFYGNNSLFTPYKCSLYKFNLGKTALQQMEAIRRDIGLYSLGDYEKKLIFNLSHPGTEFLIGAQSVGIYNFSDRKSEDMFKKFNELILKDIPNCTISAPSCKIN